MKAIDVSATTKDLLDFLDTLKVDGFIKEAALRSAASILEHIRNLETQHAAMRAIMQNALNNMK